MLFYCERERGVNTVIGSANDAFLIPHSPMARFYWPSNVYKVFVLPFIYSSNGSNTYYNGQDSILVLSVQKLRFSSPKFKQYTALDRKFPLWLVIVIPSLTLPYYLTRGNLLLVWGSESAEPESGARSRSRWRSGLGLVSVWRESLWREVRPVSTSRYKPGHQSLVRTRPRGTHGAMTLTYWHQVTLKGPKGGTRTL